MRKPLFSGLSGLKLLTGCIFTVVFFAHSFCLQAQEDSLISAGKVFKISIKEEIFPAAERKLLQGFDQAIAMDADLIFLELDTYGGLVNVADNMRTAILNSEIPIAVFILNNAASAGALISIACDSIYMTREATIGAAVVVEGGGGGAASEKYQSYFREKMRATAESKGRDPDIAEAMVNPDVFIEGLIDTGKILTMTAKTALEYGFCEKIVKKEHEVIEAMGFSNYSIVEYKETAIDKVISFFTNPMVSGILLSIIFFGIFFELQSPGVGFPLVAALVAALCYFTPHYLEDLANAWEILLFVAGLILIGVEIFVIPGFGFVGILGLILAFGGIFLSMIQNVDFNFDFVKPGEVIKASLVTLVSVFVTIIASAIFARNLGRGGWSRNIVLQTQSGQKEGFSVNNFIKDDLVGKEGSAITDLKPSGKVLIENERYDAYTAGELINRDERVRVVRAKGISLQVEKV